MITRSYLLPSLVLGSVSRRARLLVEESVMAGHGVALISPTRLLLRFYSLLTSSSSQLQSFSQVLSLSPSPDHPPLFLRPYHHVYHSTTRRTTTTSRRLHPSRIPTLPPRLPPPSLRLRSISQNPRSRSTNSRRGFMVHVSHPPRPLLHPSSHGTNHLRRRVVLPHSGRSLSPRASTKRPGRVCDEKDFGGD